MWADGGEDALVEVAGVAKSYRTGEVVTEVLRNVDLRVARHEFLCSASRAAARRRCSI
jgi:ABC-type nitrate/sulfonate/bicarbonate transport system ATPase subunit